MTPEVKEIAESLAPIVSETVKEEVAEATKSFGEELKSLSTEMVNFKEKMASVSTGNVEAQSKMAREVFVKSAVEVLKNGIQEEAPAMKIFQANAKAAFQNEGIATEGLEFVFDQFSNDVLMWLKNYPLVDSVGSMNIKGVTIKLPTWVNSLTAAWITEGSAIPKSKGTTGFLTFNVKKLASLVSVTEEMLEDNMTNEDLYQLFVMSAGNSQAAVIENGIINSESTNMLGIIPNANTVNVVLATGNTQLRNVTATVLDNALIDLDSAIADEYVGNVNNAVAIMSKYTLGIFKKAKTTDGSYLYPELREANPKLLGKYRIITSTKMPVQSQAQDLLSTKQVIIGNLKEFYMIVRSRQFTATRGYSTGDFEADLQSVKITQRLTGNVLAGQAFAVLATSAT